MKVYGLIGHPLGHSFSRKYFTEKFAREGIIESEYRLFDITTLDSLPEVLQTNGLRGLNVTIPHKSQVIPYLDQQDAISEAIGAVNVIKITENNKLIGYNSDYYGFKISLERFVSISSISKALVLGTGGASLAVEAALTDLSIPYLRVSRSKGENQVTYEELGDLSDYRLIVNTTPLGMTPEINTCPNLNYDTLNSNHVLYDLVYNPKETLFMKKGLEKGAKVINGLEMLHLQAEKSWEIWNS